MFSQISRELHSAKVRLGLAFLLSFLLLLPVANVYAAGSANGSTVTPTNSDICVEGTVINHQEEPLDDGRIVTATAEDGTVRRSYRLEGENEPGFPPGQTDLFYQDRGDQLAVFETYSAYAAGNELVPVFQQVLDSLRVSQA